MKNFRLYILLIGGFVLLSGLSNCKDKPTEQPEFDRATLLANVNDNYITVGYADLLSKISDLESAFLTFENSTAEADFNVLQTAYVDAYMSWQGIKMIDFGPAASSGLKRALTVYPTDTVKIESNISNGNYILGSIDNLDAVGFPSLDFLLYNETNGSAYSKSVASQDRLTYIGEVIAKMKTEVSNVVTSWGAYASSFKASTGTSSTSSVSYMVNEFNKDYELTKNAKLGIPIGTQSLGIARPEYIEAPFSGISIDLMKENVRMLHRFFNGDHYSTGAAGIGFDDYLKYFENQEGVALASNINNKFNSILSNLDQYSSTSLKVAINTQPSDLNETYNLIQTMVPCIKTDMPGTFGILITYQDNDGD